MGMLQEFKEFTFRGNVLDLAVGIVIGAAFAAIVIGIIAAGVCGYVGSPQELPTTSVSTSMQIEPHNLHLFFLETYKTSSHMRTVPKTVLLIQEGKRI